MKNLYIFDPGARDKLGRTRGGGRMVQILHENLADKATFVSDLAELTNSDQLRPTPTNSTLLIPFWKPFEPPVLTDRISDIQYLSIYDTIPLKYPQHFPPGIRGTIRLWQNKQALRHFDGIITISESAKADIVKYLPVSEEIVHVVYPTTARIFFKMEERHKSPFSIPPSPFCVYTGDVNWNKNLVTLARAIKAADVTCVFVGKEFSDTRYSILDTRYSHQEQKQFVEFLSETQNDKRFIFTGYLKDQDLINLYQHAVCNLLVSYDEGFGLSYLEAATQRCPSILSDIPVFQEIASDSTLYANPDDHFALAEKIKELFKDQKLRAEFGGKAHSRASKLFSPGVFKQQILKILI